MSTHSYSCTCDVCTGKIVSTPPLPQFVQEFVAQIKPCPFCRCDDVGICTQAIGGEQDDPNVPREVFITCCGCGACSSRFYDTVENPAGQALLAWNGVAR